MRERGFLFIFAMGFLAFLGCAHEWQNPNTALPSKELSIDALLINPIVYDSAGVIIEGKVWDLAFKSLKEKDIEIPYTSFKLADQDGNFVNVFALGDIPVAEGDIVKVVGIYRREYNTENYSFLNEIEAKRIETKSNSTNVPGEEP
jgi:uncharacterized membrane protein